MNEPGREERETQESAGQGDNAGRKPYRKPSFQFEQVFETRALVCGKIQPTTAGCGFSRSAS